MYYVLEILCYTLNLSSFAYVLDVQHTETSHLFCYQKQPFRGTVIKIAQFRSEIHKRITIKILIKKSNEKSKENFFKSNFQQNNQKHKKF